MSPRLFGFEIFLEIEIELEKLKNLYPYSNNNEVNNAMINLCKEAVKVVADRKKQSMSSPSKED
jgi:hypothetical protein|tara:strand:+ start:1025 stop:1216 length:192 start_codon:yes stop_codon:yes gene_type:complete